MSKGVTSGVDLVEVTAEQGSEYGQKSVQVLRDAAHIRQNPGMYVGDTRTFGLHHLAFELVYNAVDEALAGHCKHIHVKVHADESLSVADDGRGIPIEMHAKENRPTLEVVMTVVGAGAKFDNAAYKVSAGLHGMGAKAVTALSEWSTAEVRRNGRTYRQKYEKGHPVTKVDDIGAANRSGTTITFKPDPEIFHDLTFQYDTLATRLRELAFLNRGLSIALHDERTGQEETFKFDGGIAEYVAFINGDDAEHKPPIALEKTVGDVRVEIALQYGKGDDERVRCYANNAYNPVGGTHLSGFRTGLTRTLKAYGEKNNLFKAAEPVGDDFREGLTAIVSVNLPDPQFEAQMKVRLNNPEVDGIVASVVYEQLSKFLEENPKDAQKIINKVVLAAKAREAAAAARRSLKDRKEILNSGGLPGKLMDCTTRDRDASELFLVEGDSAGGSAESGRDRMYQAILPLRGKPLNVEKARLEHLLNNSEITSIIAALGIDIGNPEDISKLRYGKVVILTDADVDGQHIRTLLLTFFFRQMRKLIEDGRVYVARPPLYKVVQKKQTRFVQTAETMHTELMARGLTGTRLVILTGREPVIVEGDRLAKLVQVAVDMEHSLQVLERRGLTLQTLAAKAGPAGLPVFRVLLDGHEHWFFTAAETDEFRRLEGEKRGRELVVGDDTATVAATPPTNGEAAVTLFVHELHEVRAINRGLERLKEFGLTVDDLIPPKRVAGREPPLRYALENGDSRKVLSQLRDLGPEVRRLGEKGLAVTRFKGLGEMDPEELWETTLDPAKRTLLRVTLDKAFEADRMFRVLMGEQVEPRRQFIHQHALEAKDIDLHAG